MRSIPLAFALLLLASPLFAAPPDTRVRSILFTPDKVIRLVGKPGYQSSVRFAPDERIENIAVGDSAAWQVTPNKRGDHLFIKPMIANARSNLMVVTDRRTYLFDLEASRTAQPVYALSFRYPDYPAPGSVPPPPAPPPSSVPVAVAAATPPKPLNLNFGWQTRGAKSLRPLRVFDDASAVYLRWPENVALPAVLVPAPDGTESPVNYKLEGGYIVLDGLPQQIIVRKGREQAIVTADRRRTIAVQTARSEDRRERR
ncbi:TrbG/VirB9 family P-type conjugative transfer protein [Sphingomonas sp. BN140010]|uniref:TrbG/VirB9 family P-type conjugative transfer protein n=1 Tax=Sphingomonas arvum TaxID=2992113 RepID=A0ABT3JDP6_9SPHN|nr:TrbG/VirB9 family P-type conjugative transfer protein [Sphingomonas sp. BN140010]MCW3796885.1 TrbG/VirB9 family P-type conjugative transfer protein [Sphingomonas sp. BN140010]